MKKFSAFLFFLLFSIFTTAQRTIPEFGAVTLAELQMKSCSFEPDAPVMKLFDIQEAEYEPSPFGGKIRTEKRVRIKIFNEKGYSLAAIKIPYYSNKKNTKISDLKGITYFLNEKGNIDSQKIEEADFFKQKAMERIGLLSFTFPNLRPGCVIEYSYVITEKNRLQFDTWIMSSEMPAAYVSNSIIVPTYSSFKEYTFNSGLVSKKTELMKKGLDRNKITFFKENIPSFKPEPFMSSSRDNMARMAFLLFEGGNPVFEGFNASSLWKVVANQMLKTSFFEDQYKKIIPGTEKIIDTALSMKNTQERIEYLYKTVKKRIPDKTGWAPLPDDITDAWKTRSASSAEINMILMNFLHRSNINCFPVLLSTRENGKINLDFPSFGQFNAMDILVSENNLTYLIDASLKYQPYNIPPQNTLNRQVFVLDPDNIRWVLITDDRPLLRQSANIFATMTNEGKLEAGATVSYFDYAKSIFLDSSDNHSENKNQGFIDKKGPGLTLLSDKREDNGNGESYVQTIEFDYEAQQSGEFYFISPQLLTGKKTSPFIQAARNTDIDFGCNQEIKIELHLEIPESFQVEQLPQNMMVRSEDSSFAFTRIVYADKSNITYSQVFEIKKAFFAKEKYKGLYDFYKNIYGLMSEEIILKKKK